MKSLARILSFVILATFVSASAEADTRLLRYPDIHGNRVVFSYAGDLWLATTEGGLARRLTAHPGLELFAKFSPDGKWLAFTGQYDGDEQVYVMDARGGVPKQLTYYPASGPLPDRWGYDNQVYGWSADGKKVLFRSMRYGWSTGDNQLFTVSPDGGLPEPLPMPAAGAGDLSPDGKRVVYSPLFRDFRTWKRYQGGWAQDLYVFDLKSHEHVQITDHPRTDRDPMWIGDTIYFASDRTDTLNIFSYDLKSKATNQVTKSNKFDVRWPSRGDGNQIIYELAGQLHVLDTTTGKSRLLNISVPTDGLAMRPKRIAVGNAVRGFGLSPKGERAVFAARGDIFTAPVEKGPTRNLTQSSSAHDKSPDWSPDGSQIAFISDRDGEEEIYLVDAKGEKPIVQLTDGGDAMRYSPSWSADGKRIAFSDKSGKLFVINVADKSVIQVADDKHSQIRDFVWSPKGGHLAFSQQEDNGFGSIYIWSVVDGKTRRVTSTDFNEFEPAWDPEGNYLFYFADRQFAPQLGSLEWNFMIDRESGIFAVALRNDVKHPFPPESDEAAVESSEGKKPEAKKDDAESNGDVEKKSKREKRRNRKNKKNNEEKADADKGTDDKTEYIKIDFDGLVERVAKVPVEDDNYYGLYAVKGHLLFVRSGASYYGRGSDVRPALQIFDMKSRKVTTLAEGAGGYALSATGNKILVRQGGGFQLFDATPQGKGSAKSVSTSGLMANVDPSQEWRQIFDEVWRRYRDFFYVANMHGYDWEALRQQYLPLLDHAAHRSDLSYIINEMIAELNVGHAYNSGGDYVVPDRAAVGLPGARFELDRKSGRYRIAKILRGQNEEPRYRSPLTEIGVIAQEGDYVMAIDGEELQAGDNPYRMFRNKSNHPISLTLNSKPNTKGARTVSFRPIGRENDLVYLNWVRDNRRKVSEATDGRVGYIHLPDMGSNGIREFAKWFYSQTRKEGMIVDVRSNGGGNVSQMVIERLRRTLLATGFSRNNDSATTYPGTVFHGHLVCLLDENSASDGDIFPAMFREAGLGPLIGKRSWGGVIGITNRGTLIDGGTVNVPEFGFASAAGEWILEGYGVEPDIEVDNDPASVIKGRDPQLERGIEEVLKRMTAEPRKLPSRPAAPVKTPRE